MRFLRKMLTWIFFALVAAFVVLAILIRVAPDEPGRWHVDPSTVVEHGAQNDFIVNVTGEEADIASAVYDKSPEMLMQAFAEIAMAAPKTTVLSTDGGYTTFIQRTSLMAFPDYISVKAVEVEGGSALLIYSRSRYGVSDLGVNKKRILSWLGKL